jgi:hypothetical protein
MPSPTFCLVDDKHVPLYRIVWISAVPHFCGNDDCDVEGLYEVRLEQDESLWANQKERDTCLAALEQWCGGKEPDADGDWN